MDKTWRQGYLRYLLLWIWHMILYPTFLNGKWWNNFSGSWRSGKALQIFTDSHPPIFLYLFCTKGDGISFHQPAAPAYKQWSPCRTKCGNRQTCTIDIGTSEPRYILRSPLEKCIAINQRNNFNTRVQGSCAVFMVTVCLSPCNVGCWCKVN